MKKILVLLALCIGMPAMAYNYYNHYSNPAHPLHIMNPANPASPINPIYHQHRDYNYTRKTNSKEIFTYRVFRVYELCYKGVCRQTTSRELKSQINCCLRHDGGSACLNKVIE